MITLKQHQQEIVDDDLEKTGIFHTTGGGKTITTLSLAQGKTLVVCPKQQRDDKTWQKNLEKLGKELDLTVISKEQLRTQWESLPHFDTVIMDEAHEGLLGVTPSVKWKNRVQYPKTSQMFEAMRQYIKREDPERIYIVTATPVRAPMAVFAIGVLLGRWKMEAFWRFRDKYYFPMPTDQRIFLPRNDKATKERLGEVVRKLGYTGRLQDWMDVPDQTFKTEHVGLTASQESAIEMLPLIYPEPLVYAQKQYQIENGFMYDDEDEVTQYQENYTKKLWDYYEEFGRLYIVAVYTWQIEYIERFFKSKKVQTFVLNSKAKDRKKLLEDANSTESGVFIAQAQMTSGYELPEYPCGIFVSTSHRICDYQQALGRLLRQNALKKNLYVHIVTGEQSKARWDSISNKKDFSEAIYAKKLKIKQPEKIESPFDN